MQTENSYTPTVCDNTLEKEPLQFVSQEVGRAFLFLITLSLLGLSFLPAYVFLAAVMFNSYLRNKYDFLIQFTILCGSYGFYKETEAFPFKWMDIALLLSAITILFYRRDKGQNKLLLFTFGYIAVLFLFALMSEESMKIQIRRMREYCGIIYFMVPMLIFAKEDFDMKVFFRKFLTYAYIIAIFYIIDSFVFGGNILVPATFSWNEQYSTYYRFYCQIGSFPRKYPHGLFLLALCIFPMVKFYTLRTKQIVIFSLALIASRTISIIGGIIITIMSFTGNFKKLLKYLCLFAVLFVAGYYIDGKVGGALRIQQFVGQFSALQNPNDVEKLAEFGTGRMAQIIPKFALLFSENRQYIGLGFLHDIKTTIDKYVIINELYSDISRSEEVSTAVEETHAQTILDIGIIGLLLQTFYFLAIYFWVLRPMPYSISYLMTFVALSLFGVGGFAGVITHYGLLLLGLNVGIIYLADKQLHKNEDYESNT